MGCLEESAQQMPGLNLMRPQMHREEPEGSGEPEQGLEQGKAGQGF